MTSRVDDDFLTLLDAWAMGADPAFAVNDRNRIVFWNSGMHRLYGYDANDVMGKSCDVVLAGADCHGNRYCSDACPISQMAKRDETAHLFTLLMKPKEGVATPAEITVLKFVLPQSKHFLLLHVVRPLKIQEAQPAATVADTTVQRIPQGLAAAIRGSADARVRELTNREIEILGMLAGGIRPIDIAEQLCISPLTARNHIQNVFEKLEVHSQAEAVAFAYKKHLV